MKNEPNETIRKTQINMKNEPNETIPTDEIPPPEVKLPSDKITTINVDDIKPNTILLIKVDAESPIQKMAIAPMFSKLLNPYANLLRDKKVTVILMTAKEDITTVSEEEMNQAGWFKKEKSLIINPFSKQ